MTKTEKQEALKIPKDAYNWAFWNGACNDTRKAVCQNSYWAYAYAVLIDLSPRDDTRTAACKQLEHAYRYAKHVDKCFHEETWNAVKKDPFYMQQYLKNVESPPIKRFWIEAKVEPEKNLDNNAGKIYNPLTGKWSWF